MLLTKLNQQFPNKICFITGAASGLGASFARLLAHNQWTLHLADLNREALELTKDQLAEAADVHFYTLDVSDQPAYNQVQNEVSKHNKQIDLLINNAGIGDGSLFHTYDPESWEHMIQVNLMGTYYGCHLFLPMMLSQKNGLIINVGSAAGYMNAPGMSAYNVSKAAVYSLSETIYHELKPKNIHVSVLTPSFFKTNVMQHASGSDEFKAFAAKQMKYSTTNADEVARITLEEAAKGTFQIVLPKEARRNRFFKKWFPKVVERKFEKMLAKFSQF